MRGVRSSVRGQIVLAAVLGTSVALVLVGALVLAGARLDERGALDRRLERRAAVLANSNVLDAVTASEGRPVLSGVAATLLAVNDLGLRLVENGRVIRAAGTAPPRSVPPASGPGTRTVRTGGERWRVVTVTIAGRPNTRLEVSGSLEPVQATVQRLRRRIVVIGLIGLLLAAALAAIASNRAVAALGRLRSAAGDVADTTHLDRRVPTGGPAEVDAVADAINALLGRLEGSVADREHAYEATRRFAADAGHELRTPLAVLGTTLETLARNPALPPSDRAEMIDEAVSEQQRLTTLVAALQALTRGEAGPLGDEAEVDLAAIVESAIAAAERAGGVEITAHLGATPALHASPTGLRLLLDNLLRNAAVHARGARPAAQVQVRLAAEAGGIVLTIDDDGPGIPPGERDAARARFARGAAARGDGSGLGLAIVEQQARRLGATLALEQAPLGGLRVHLTIPHPAPERGA